MTESSEDRISKGNPSNRVTTLNRGRVLLLLALLLSVGLALWVQWPRLMNPINTQDDFRGYYWFNAFQDPDLYPDIVNPATYRITEFQLFDLEVRLPLYILSSLRAAYHLFFFLASPVFSPILFNKLLIFPLILFLTYFAFRIGQELKGNWTGFALAMTFVVFNLASADSISVASGMPRAFAMPVLLALIYYLMMQRYMAAGIVIAISGIIYAPVFVLSLVTFILAILGALRAGRIKLRFGWQTIVVFLVLGVVSLIVVPKAARVATLFWSSLLANVGTWGLLNDPLYTTGGRYHLFEQYFIVGRGAMFTKFSNFWQTLALFLFALGSWLLTPRRQRIFPKPLKQLLIAAVACFIAAWAAIILASNLTLYYPSRYLRATLPIVLIIVTVTNLEQALMSARVRLKSLTPSLRITVALVLAVWTVGLALLSRQELSPFFTSIPDRNVEWLLIIASAFAVGALMLVIFGSIRAGDESWSTSWSRQLVTVLVVCLLAGAGVFYVTGRDAGHGFLPISTSQLEYLDFVQTLSKDSKLASGSCVLDNIPMFARRQALWTCENISASKQVMIVDTLKAYYAASLDSVLNFCRQYEVDYVVVSKEAFEESQVKVGDYPFGAYRAFLTAEADPLASHVLGDVPDSMRVYEDEDVIVVQCELGNFGELAGQSTSADGLSFLAFDETPETLSQAGEAKITLKWTAEKEIPADYDVCFSVEDQSGEVKQKVCKPLPEELLASQQSIPATWYETYTFRISPYLESGDYSIVASVFAGDEVVSSSDIADGGFTYSALPRTFNLAQMDLETEPKAVWGEAISLVDYVVTESDSNNLVVNLTWHALQRLPESYKVFAHLRKAGTDEIVSQVDTIPQNWTYPTDWWEANEFITDTLSIPLNDIEPGQYELWLGLYIDETGERLPLADPLDPTLIPRDEAVMIYALD
ncbi:MAG: hypothetical protein JSW55_12965 [Chloroflexota bacterium]|nr:MAG: hypothetical protein JSW55_12965 [Chloroflexota bacterium]